MVEMKAQFKAKEAMLIQKAEENLQKKFETKQIKSLYAFKDEVTSIKSQFRKMKKD